MVKRSTTITISAEVYEALRKESKDKQVSFSQLIDDILFSYTENKTKFSLPPYESALVHIDSHFTKNGVSPSETLKTLESKITKLHGKGYRYSQKHKNTRPIRDELRPEYWVIILQMEQLLSVDRRNSPLFKRAHEEIANDTDNAFCRFKAKFDMIVSEYRKLLKK